jgi:hypothetical protein
LERDGILIEGDENLLKHASKYYSDLFGPPIEYEVQIDPTLWDGLPKVLDEENSLLCRPFIETEIKEALDQIEKTRLRGQIKFRLNSIKAVGTLLKKTLSNFLMTFTTNQLILVD